MPKLRKLTFASLKEVAADIETLRESGYVQGAEWNLSQICEHLAKTMKVGLLGRVPPQGSWIARHTLFRLLFWIVIKTGWMPSGAKAPDLLQPGDREEDDLRKIDQCLNLLLEADSRTEPIPPFPFAAGINLPKWKRLQQVHAAHHLSFLKPDNA